MPKLAIAIDSGCHLILSAKVRIGNGSDAPDFDALLYDAVRRLATCARPRSRGRVRAVVADAGYDSEANHRIAREDLGVRSIIAVGIGRPTSKLPSGRWRRHMKRRFARKADQKLYGQPSQSETAKKWNPTVIANWIRESISTVIGGPLLKIKRLYCTLLITTRPLFAIRTYWDLRRMGKLGSKFPPLRMFEMEL